MLISLGWVGELNSLVGVTEIKFTEGVISPYDDCRFERWMESGSVLPYWSVGLVVEWSLVCSVAPKWSLESMLIMVFC